MIHTAPTRSLKFSQMRLQLHTIYNFTPYKQVGFYPFDFFGVSRTI